MAKDIAMIRHVRQRAVDLADQQIVAVSEVRTSVYDHLHASDDALIIDETGFLKQGTHSADMQRQYSGTAGHALRIARSGYSWATPVRTAIA